MDPNRQFLAKVAHTAAHEVSALRDAGERIAQGEDPQHVLRGMIDERMQKIDLIAEQGKGNA